MNPATDSGSGVWWRRVLLACCAMLVMIVSIPAAAVFPADNILFQPEPYLEQIERSGFYETYPGLAFDLLEAGGSLPCLAWPRSLRVCFHRTVMRA